jgi:3-deoxy-D-manno-octulosonic-acid transferase
MAIFIDFCLIESTNMFLYKLFLWVYPLLAKIIRPLNEKVRQWHDGQQKVWEEMEANKSKITKPIIWVHCASYGEFEQGLPIIESLKKAYPAYQIWLSFFSPSGYLHRKNDPAVDMVTYLPFDSAKNAAKFLDIAHPKLIIFIKYEFWFYYLNEAKKRNIPTLLASAIFREDQIFFKWYGTFYKKILNLFTGILVQDTASFELIHPILQNTPLAITGDTRFDRVVSTVQWVNPIEWVPALLSHDKIIIAGSTWKEDHAILSDATQALPQFNWIIVPHHVDTHSIAAAKKQFNHAMTLTELLNSKTKQEKPILLIVDCIGLLRNLYQYAYITYVGGGFGKDGVHNVLEPAAFGKPVIWGHNDSKYREAVGLRNAGGGMRIENEVQLLDHLQHLIQIPAAYSVACENAQKFIQIHAGATQKTIQWIQAQQLLHVHI